MSEWTYTVKELIEELSKLPQDSVVSFPVRWTVGAINEVYGDELKAPITEEQWVSIAENYERNLSEFFYEDSDQAMREAMEDYLKEDE